MRAFALAVLCWSSTATAGDGPLDGLTVYLSAGHGYVVHARGEGWQRPVRHGLLEDTWTARFATRELIPALERAGAVVLTARERDPHRERVLVDDKDPGFSTDTGLVLAEDTLIQPQDLASWNLSAPHTGTWQLYARWQAEADQTQQATYTVHTANRTVEQTVSQRVHGDEWWPLARLELNRGDWIRVDLKGEGEGLVSADAVRLGGGQYLLQTSDGPRDVRAWDAAAVHRLEAEGVPAEVWNVPGGGMGGDASARARWADWSHPDSEEAVYLSLHTDAGGGSGTTAFVRRRCTECDERSIASTLLANALRETVVDQIRAQHAPEWRDRGTRAAALAEVSDELNPEIPAVLLEFGFHDHRSDAKWLASTEFQATLADSLARGLIQYRDTNAPLPPAPASDVEWKDGTVVWTSANTHAHGPSHGWRVRARSESARWTTLQTTGSPRADVPADVIEIELTSVGPGGEGRPIRVERAESAVAEGPN